MFGECRRLTKQAVGGGDARRHGALVPFSSLPGRAPRLQDGAGRAPPRLAARLRRPQEVSPRLAAPVLARLRVGVHVRVRPAVAVVILRQRQAVAEGVRLAELSVGTGGLEPLPLLLQLRGGGVCEGAPPPRAALVGLRTLPLEADVLDFCLLEDF